MTKLTAEEIKKFHKSGINEDAVWNFLCTAHHCGGYINALANLDMDAKLHGWSKQTKDAIYQGLKFANEKTFKN